MQQRAVIFLLLLFLIAQISGQIPLSPCIYGRAVGGYDVPPPPPGSAGGAHPTAWPTGTLDGTCHLGSAQTVLPSWYAAGYLAAPDDETYNGFPWINAATDIVSGGVGKSCGECFQLFGDAGSITVMVADVCDKPCVGCQQCQGSLGGPQGPKDVPVFSVHSTVIKKLTNGNNGGVPIAIRKVTCDMSSIPGIGVVLQYANEGTPQMTYFRMRVYGSRVGISDVSIKGPVGGATGGNWVSLKRYWEGTFNWTNSGDIGGAFQVRVTSIYGESLLYPGTIAAADLQANKLFPFNAQFKLPTVASGGGSTSDPTCQFPGTDPVIFADRLGGDNFNPWYDFGSSVSGLSFTTTSGCFRGSACMSFQPSAAWTMIQLSPHGGIGAKQSQYSTLSFYAKSATAATIQVNWGYNDYTQTGAPAVNSAWLSFTTTTAWTKFSFLTSDFWAGMGSSNWMRTLRFQLKTGGATSTVFFDDIALSNPSGGLLYWVADPKLAGPPALGQCDYAGPAVCCYTSQAAVYSPQGPSSPSPPAAPITPCTTTAPPTTVAPTTVPLPTTTTPAPTTTTPPPTTTTPAPTTTVPATTTAKPTTTVPATTTPTPTTTVPVTTTPIPTTTVSATTTPTPTTTVPVTTTPTPTTTVPLTTIPLTTTPTPTTTVPLTTTPLATTSTVPLTSTSAPTTSITPTTTPPVSTVTASPTTTVALTTPAASTTSPETSTVQPITSVQDTTTVSPSTSSVSTTTPQQPTTTDLPTTSDLTTKSVITTTPQVTTTSAPPVTTRQRGRLAVLGTVDCSTDVRKSFSAWTSALSLPSGSLSVAKEAACVTAKRQAQSSSSSTKAVYVVIKDDNTGDNTYRLGDYLVTNGPPTFRAAQVVPAPSTQKKNPLLWIVLGAIIAVILLVALVAIIVIIVLHKKKQAYHGGRDSPYFAYTDDHEKELRRPLNPLMDRGQGGGFIHED